MAEATRETFAICSMGAGVVLAFRAVLLEFSGKPDLGRCRAAGPFLWMAAGVAFMVIGALLYPG